MAEDAHWFTSRAELESAGWALVGNMFERPVRGGATERMRPLYEGKMIHHFDHRWATHDGSVSRDVAQAEHRDPDFHALPRYWVEAAEVDNRLEGKWNREWLLTYRNIARSTDERTMIISAIPRAAVSNSSPLLMARRYPALLYFTLSSIALDFAARQKNGGSNMTFFIVEQLPVPPPDAFEHPCPWHPAGSYADWILPRLLELVYTARDMSGFASDLGDEGGPFVWDLDRRAAIRAELDACALHLYGLDRTDSEYVLGTFPIANRKDPDLTPRILTAYDALAEAVASGEAFVSPLDPPPGHGLRHD